MKTRSFVLAPTFVELLLRAAVWPLAGSLALVPAVFAQSPLKDAIKDRVVNPTSIITEAATVRVHATAIPGRIVVRAEKPGVPLGDVVAKDLQGNKVPLKRLPDGEIELDQKEGQWILVQPLQPKILRMAEGEQELPGIAIEPATASGAHPQDLQAHGGGRG